jgi:hypothetical protein
MYKVTNVYWKSYLVICKSKQQGASRCISTNVERTVPTLPIEQQKTVLAKITSDFKYPEDFYKLSANEISRRGGGELLKQYSHPHELLSSVYPEHEWLPWKFEQIPLSYWDNVNNQRKFMDWAGKQLKINEMSDWYKITRKVREGTSYLMTVRISNLLAVNLCWQSTVAHLINYLQGCTLTTSGYHGNLKANLIICWKT